MEPGWGVQLHVSLPYLRYSPLDNWDFIGGMVLAMPDRPDGRFIRCRDGEGCAQSQAQGTVGWEVLLGVKHTWHNHLMFSLEGAYAKATDRLPLESAGSIERQFLCRSVEAGLSIQIVVSPPYGRYSRQSEFAGFSSEGESLHCVPLVPQIQPSSLDLRLGAKVWQLRCSFYPERAA